MEALFEGDGKDKSNPRAKRTAKQEANDVIWDTLAAIFMPSGVGPDEKALLGKIVRNLKAKKATPDEILRRVANFPRVFPRIECGCTLPGLNRQWDKLGEGKPFIPGPSKDQVKHEADERIQREQRQRDKRAREAATQWYQEQSAKGDEAYQLQQQILASSNEFMRRFLLKNLDSLALEVFRAWQQRKQER